MFRFLRVKEENWGQLEPYHNISWIQWKSAELVTPAPTDFASLSLLAAQFWQCDIIAVVAAISPPPLFFFFPVKELWLLCWWVIHITEADAQIPETSFYCCIKAVRARGDGLWKTSLEKNIWTGRKSEEVSTQCHSEDIKCQVNCFSELFFFFNSHNGPVFVLALITEVKLLIQPSAAHYVWTFGEFQFGENH